MERAKILARIDHTALSPTLTWDEVACLCAEAQQYHTASVCIPPTYVATAAAKFPQLNIGTVVGFPLGYHTAAVKALETREALTNGASEIDMVINLTWAKNGEFAKIEREIAALKELCGSRILKVIVETCYLTEAEKIALCHSVAVAGGDYLKTSTGFGSQGAVISDIELLRENLPAKVKIKAAGGMATVEEMMALIEAGADRLGTSKGLALLVNEA